MSTTISSLEDLRTDERWLLVQRIICSAPFQKSNRLRELLQYVAQETLRGNAHELTEQHIGNALFHKPSNYSPLEDSSVRVHVRQLRLKLHEYFNEEGRTEPVVLEIPKGSYAPIFRVVQKETAVSAAVEPPPIPATAWARKPQLPWTFCVILAALCVALGLRILIHRPSSQPGGSTSAPLSWPSSQIFDARHQTILVVADSNYGMSRILSRQSGSLNQYLRQEFLSGPEVSKIGAVDSSLSEYLSNSTLTSFADVANVISLFRMAGSFQSQVLVRYPRDLRMRDLDHNNYVFIGSPGSNPWVSLLQDKLNFRESEGVVGKSAKVFANTNPLPGELPKYEGLRWTGTMGEDYATIALLPNATHDGSVLALQGLQQEGTEAAGRFLADEENRRQLMKALRISEADAASHEIWFEALIRSRTVSGAPNSTTLVAVRRIQ
ncbi:MAG TPA: hypothetical protein VK525_19980 [Candidatus Saccharimonadales bacterium]|nr:hypothetical protein [Candidatus Saccharimonadales bacterium]